MVLGKKVNVKLTIEYDGKNYYGWQTQNHKEGRQKTVQDTIEETLRVLFPNQKIKLIGSGRTDACVHALNQVANVMVSLNKFTLPKLVNSMNAILPDDIVIKRAQKVSDDFNARFSAKKRSYLYYITTSKHAINGDKMFYVKTKFDLKLAKEFCKTLIGNHSFRYMCKNKTDERDFRSIIYSAKISKSKNGVYIFSIEAKRFLHSMVRAIVGMMVEVASGKTSNEEFKTKFNKGEELSIQYAPSNALFLNKVTY